MQTKNLAIMFTDIKGYTERTSAQSHDQTSSLLKQHQGLVMPIIQAFHGRLIKTIGDAFLVVFTSPTNSVLCGMTIQDRLHKYNHGKPEQDQIQLRIAINVGEVILTRGDVFGEPVNIASRVEGITPAKEVYLTESVYLTMNRTEVNAERVGDFTLKGIPEPVTVYRIPSTNAAHTSGPGDTTGAHDADDGDDGDDDTTSRISAHRLVTLPYGGEHLARIEAQVLTPSLKRNLVIAACVLLLMIIALATIPSYIRDRQWEQIEASIGRGKIDTALALLSTFDYDDSERARFFELQVQVATRLIERSEAEQAADLLAVMKPQGMQEESTHFKMASHVLEQLIDQESLDYAARLLEIATPRSEADKQSLLEIRHKIAESFLKRGRLEELANQVKILLEGKERNARAHLLQGHLYMALSSRENTAENLFAAIEEYDKALSIEMAIGDDETLQSNIAQTYNNGIPDKRLRNKLIARTDLLVDKYLRTRIVTALIKQLNKPNNSKESRDWLAARITKLGGEQNVDYVKLIIQDLTIARCTTTSGQESTQKIIEKLSEEGSNDPRAVGVLLKYALQRNPCRQYALDAVQKILGERVEFRSTNQITFDELIPRLANTSCQKRSAMSETEEIIKQLTLLDNKKAVGPLIQLAIRDSRCTDIALKAVETLAGKRLAFEPAKEGRHKELQATLKQQRCRGRRGKAALLKTIDEIVKENATIAIGELLGLARKGDSCSASALQAVQKLTKLKELAITTPVCPKTKCPECPKCEAVTTPPPAKKATKKRTSRYKKRRRK